MILKRDSTTLFLQTPGYLIPTTTPIPWVNDAPDFSAFTEPTLSVLQNSWQAFLNSGQELEIIPDPEPVPEPTTPDWDGFNAAILADTAFNTYYATGLSTAPAVTTSIPAALTQVESKGQSAFALVYTGFCTAVNVSSADRDSWAGIAQTYNLPVDFVNLIRG